MYFPLSDVWFIPDDCLCRVRYSNLWMTCLRPSSARPIEALCSHWPSSTCLTSWTTRPYIMASMIPRWSIRGSLTGEAIRLPRQQWDPRPDDIRGQLGSWYKYIFIRSAGSSSISYVIYGTIMISCLNNFWCVKWCWIALFVSGGGGQLFLFWAWNIFVIHFQPSSEILGECCEEPWLCLRRLQVEHRWCLSVSDCADVHG